MPAEKRLAAAEAFWRDDQGDIAMQHMDAMASIARRLNFRAKSVQALSIDRKAKHLSQMSDVSDAVATLRSSFPPDDVDLYLHTLSTLDGDTWGDVEAAMGQSPQSES